jgi:hypothetical protein
MTLIWRKFWLPRGGDRGGVLHCIIDQGSFPAREGRTSVTALTDFVPIGRM